MRWQTQERYIRNMLAQQLQIPVVGKVFFAVPAGSSSSLYEEWARSEMDIPAELLFAGSQGPALAFGATTANRNDVVLVFPGNYDLTSELAWNKSNTHLMGLGGPAQGNDYGESNNSIYTDSADVNYAVNVTGNHCQFRNIDFTNCAADADALAGLLLNGYACRFAGVSFQGVMNATADGVENAALAIAGLASNYYFEDCHIGNNMWRTRTAALSGQVNYIATAYPYPQHGIFRNCQFVVWSETSTVGMIRLADGDCMGMLHIFDRCIFHNVSTSWAVTLASVFVQKQQVRTSTIALFDCFAIGFDEYTADDTGTRYQTNNPAAAATGGIGAEATS